MIRRRRFRLSMSLKDRLLEEAQNLRHEAEMLAYGSVRDEVLKKARQTEIAAHMEDWLNSPGLRSPRKYDTPGPT